MESGNISLPLIKCQLQNSKFLKTSITLIPNILDSHLKKCSPNDIIQTRIISLSMSLQRLVLVLVLQLDIFTDQDLEILMLYYSQCALCTMHSVLENVELSKKKITCIVGQSQISSVYLER